jgi:ABC-2 type transport system permease protein
MARLLVELKLRLVGNALRSSTAARVSFVVSTTFAALAAIGTFWLLAQLRFLSASVDLTTANLLGLLGVTIGLARGALGVLVALIAVVLQVLFCIVLARFVITSMARLLRSHRGKDLAVFLIVPVFAIFEFLIQVIPRAASSGGLSPASFAGVDSWMRWLPLGLAAHAIQDASTGHLGDAMARLGVVVAVIIVLGMLWVRSLERALVTTDASTGSSRVHNAALPLARYGLPGAVAARFLRYQRRDPASLAYWGIVVVIMFVCSASTIVGPHQHPAVVVTSAVFGAAFAGSLHANPVGRTGPAFVFEATALSGRRELRAYFYGQDLVFGAIAIPLLVGVSFLLAALVRDPKEGFVAAAVGLAGLGAALAMSNIFSVVLAYPMQKRAGNPLPQQAQGFGGYAVGATFGTLASIAVAVIPVIILGNLTSHVSAAIAVPVLFGCAASYGFGLAWLGVRAAAVAAEGKLPELAGTCGWPCLAHRLSPSRLWVAAPADSSNTPGFMIQAGSSSAFARRSAPTNNCGTSRRYQRRWSRPTAWWWVIIWASRAARVSRRLTPPPRKIGGCGRCAGLGAPSWPVLA